MIRARVVAFAAAIFAASCGAPLMKLPSGPGLPAPDSADLLTQASATCSRVSTISAELAVSGSVGGRRLRGRLLTGLAAPASLYIEAPAPFGAPLFVFGASNGDATLLLPRDRRVLEHGRPGEVLEAITGVPLDPAELRATLTGCAAGTVSDSVAAWRLGDDWRVIPGDRTWYLRREEPADAWRLVSVVRSGPEGWRADYRNFVDGLPRSIRLMSNEPRRFDLRLELAQVDLNVELAPSTFRVNVPAGTQPISIEELRAGGPLSR
jgi:hypothetical protein